jgi:hypothetical protein
MLCVLLTTCAVYCDEYLCDLYVFKVGTLISSKMGKPSEK